MFLCVAYVICLECDFILVLRNCTVIEMLFVLIFQAGLSQNDHIEVLVICVYLAASGCENYSI